MRRRDFVAIPAWGLLPAVVAGQPTTTPEPIPEPQFPSRLYLFVWRNWELANAGRIAQVIRTKDDVVLSLGESMGLPRKRQLSEEHLARIFITVIRQNWHILPEEQI